MVSKQKHMKSGKHKKSYRPLHYESKFYRTQPVINNLHKPHQCRQSLLKEAPDLPVITFSTPAESAVYRKQPSKYPAGAAPWPSYFK
jgi:hypothetical protein